MIYLYDNAIVDDLTRSFNPDNVKDPLVKVTSPEESIGLAAQLGNDDIKFPIVALTRGSDINIDMDRYNFTRLHKGVSCVFDDKTNTFYDEKAIPISLSYGLTILTTRVADMDEILKELMFKYTNMYFLNIQLPYESNRTIRFGIRLDDSGISQSNASADYVEGGKLYQSILNLECEGCVLVSYTPTKLRRTTHDVVAVPPK